ncbi:hypothetical protein ACUH9X_08180 [Dermabacteraceae bacterium P13147]
MAVRKSARAAEARRVARERAARYMEREQRLLDLAQRFGEVSVSLESRTEDLAKQVEREREKFEKKVAALTEASEADAAADRSAAAQIQQDMLKEGLSRKEVADRLGIPLKEVAKAPKKQTIEASADSDVTPENY